ncbi:transcription initiation factor TFIID subunit 3 [Aedes albopictus]|uniref:PHD-type domain-containing protein n=1 Tax=Aedes albopictus TaxID=7160 RepID=A0ABM1YI31_AEDAL
MSERYTHQLLKVVVAQICQTIGWHSIQSTPMELMIDILDQYLRDITKVTHRYAELYNRTDPNLDDVALACREMGMNLTEMQEYLEYVDPIERPFEVPKYPLPKDSHLNFMKPGSKETLTRPVHIPEHMPPMLVDSEEEQEEEERRRQMMMMGVEAESGEVDQDDVKPDIGEVVEKMEEVGAEKVAVMDASQSEEVVTFKRPLDGPVGEGGIAGDAKKSKTLSDERRPTREISSVIMTTSGFISPAREGRLPDSKPPEIPEEKPKPPPPPPPAPVSTVLPVAKIDEKFGKKAKKKPVEKEKKEKKEKKVDKKKDSADKEKEAKSRPPTPTIPPQEQLEASPSLPAPVSSITEDIKPLSTPVELPPKPPMPVPDVKPPLPIELEKPLVPPPVVPVAPLPKPKKEKAPRKKKEPKQKAQLPPMIPNPGMDVGAIFPPDQTMPPLPLPAPLVNKVTPPKPPKPKRTKMTKKQMERQYMEQLAQFQGGPLNAQNILDMLAPPGKKPLPGLFQSPLFPPQKQLQSTLPPHQQPKFPDNVAQSQLDMLQKLHPSLEITPAPGPSSIPPMHASPEKHKLNIFKKVAKKEAPPQPPPQGPIIVIDDDKSPPHQPQFPVTPMGRKRAPKTSGSGMSFQDTLSSPDMGFNMGMTPSDHSGGLGHSGSFREFSPPKTPSNLPKTPDIKMPSSSSSSASWMSDSGKFGAGPGPLFGDFPNFGLPPPPVKEEKKKKPRQPKQPKETAASKKAKAATGLLEELKLLQQFQQFPPAPSGPGPIDKKSPMQDVFNKLAMPPMPPGFLAPQLRNPGMFGMFPLPSGPGLIPENPLFNPFNPAQSFLPPGFGMPTLPPRFDISKLLPNPRPTKAPSMDFDNLDPETKLAHTPLDLQKSTCNVAPLVPPSLQIDPVPPPPSAGSSSRKKNQISPMVKEHFPQEQSLNLSIKSNVIHQNPTVPSSIIPQPPAAHQQPKFPQEPPIYPQKDLPMSSTPTTIIPSHHPPPQTPTPTTIPPQPQHLPTLAAASPTVPPITPGETIVIETDSDTNSQSTVTMAAMGISPPQSSGGSGTKPSVVGSQKDKSEKRSKNKEHKKDKKLKEGKEGKVKKKKDKKDKNKSKDRDRERPRSSHSMNQELSDGAMEQSFTAVAAATTAGAAPQEDAAALHEQIRRKEKKEKKKEKLKKEKRKEKERAAAAALESSFSDQRSSFNLSSSANSDLFTSGPSAASISVTEHRNSPDAASGSVPKLMLKLGSTNTPSPRSGTPDHHPQPAAESAPKPAEVKREASPELARISALFTRPPKLKTPGSKGKSKDADESAKAPKLSVDHSSKAAGKLDFSGTDQPTKPRPRGIQALPDTIDLFSVTPTPAHPPQPKPSPAVASGSSSSDHHPTPHSSKKPPKEPKSSKSTSASASLGVTIPAPLNTPINVQDADGNVVWICPACGRVDDGTPMIGCDGCDAWYHWVCVGIQVPPDSNEDWYCRVCIGKKQESHGDEKQKKRKKKDKKNPKD